MSHYNVITAHTKNPIPTNKALLCQTYTSLMPSLLHYLLYIYSVRAVMIHHH